MKILILYNARSGHGRLNFKSYLQALSELGAVAETRAIGADFNIASLITDVQYFDRVVVAGGDGTVSAVAGLLQGTGKPILAYPGGTANILAHNLGIPGNAKELAGLTLNGQPQATDLGELEYIRSPRVIFRHRFLRREILNTPVQTQKIHFAIMAGTGFAARLMSDAQGLKAKLGQAAYWLSAFWNLFPRRAEYRIKLDGREIVTHGIGILIINFDKIQFNLKIMPYSRANDGKFFVAVVTARSLFGLLPVIWSAFCERVGFKRWAVPEAMEIHQASCVEVTSRHRQRLQFDGELLPKSASFKVRVLPAAALFIYGNQESGHQPFATAGSIKK